MTESDERDSTAATRPHTNVSGLKQITAANYPGFVLRIPDTTRARLFADSVDNWDRQGRFPDLVLLWLPRDHTQGRRAGSHTPRAMVADNDLALGQVLERLSRSPAWASLVVFSVEDDAQNGPDHVDAHRSVLLVASPYARRGVVDSTFYTTSSGAQPVRRGRHAASQRLFSTSRLDALHAFDQHLAARRAQPAGLSLSDSRRRLRATGPSR